MAQSLNAPDVAQPDKDLFVTPGPKSHVEVVPTQEDLVAVAHELVAAAATVAAGQRQFFRIALSGGSTPEPVYASLAADKDIDWSRWQIFWSDERCVPPTSPDSNYQMVKRSLLDHLPRPPQMVVRMTGEGDPEAAALAYEEAIGALVPGNPKLGTNAIPCFDMILLGMGNDGHTASLFPHTQALQETTHLVVPNMGPPPHTARLTFTYPLLNAARRIVILVSGASKAATLHEVLSGPYQPEQYPIQAIHTTSGTLTWLVDEAAFAAIEADL